MPAELLDEALRAWREAERVLQGLPPGTPDHETARLLLGQMRELHGLIAEARSGSAERLASSATAIETARQLLREIEDRRQAPLAFDDEGTLWEPAR